MLDSNFSSLNLSENGILGVEVTWPLESGSPWERAVSDLYLDPGGYLWISGAVDSGDLGPFRSYIQVMGKIEPNTDYPVTAYMPEPINWMLDGVKLEAIAAPSVPGSVLSFGTDDELYGGIWRPPTRAQSCSPTPAMWP